MRNLLIGAVYIDGVRRARARRSSGKNPKPMAIGGLTIGSTRKGKIVSRATVKRAVACRRAQCQWSSQASAGIAPGAMAAGEDITFIQGVKGDGFYITMNCGVKAAAKKAGAKVKTSRTGEVRRHAAEADSRCRDRIEAGHHPHRTQRCEGDAEATRKGQEGWYRGGPR